MSKVLQRLDIVDVVVVAAVFGLVFSAWTMLLMARAWRRRRRSIQLEDRLGLGRARTPSGRVLRLWHEGKEATTLAPQRTGLPSLAERLDRLRRSLGWSVPLRRLAMLLAAAMLLTFTSTLAVTHSLLAGAVACLAVGFLAAGLVRRRINKMAAELERQLVDSLGLAVRSLRAGHPLLAAFEIIAKEIPPPAGEIFAEICQTQALGIGLEEAIRTAAARTPHSDMQMFATAVILQLRSGGNLADLMDRLAEVIRHRIRLKWRVRVLTSQTQFSKRVLLALPFVLMALLSTINPDYMRPLYTTNVGRALLAMGAMGLVLGAWMMNRMAVLRY